MKVIKTAIVITKPYNAHVHLRQDQTMETVAKFSARSFCGATVMPNTTPPIRTVDEASDYRDKILVALQEDGITNFVPRMTLYLTDNTSEDEIKEAVETDWIIGGKLYPQGVTTNSDGGISSIISKKAVKVFEAMQKHGLPLLIHGEHPDKNVDIFDREKRFLEAYMFTWFNKNFTGLKIVLEHITCKDTVDYIRDCFFSLGLDVAATITPHHMLFNRNDIFANGIDPHFYCKPILQRIEDSKAVTEAAYSKDACFFLGTDSAPHPEYRKIMRGGAAGIFNEVCAIEMCLEAAERHELRVSPLEIIEFTSINAPEFFGFEPSKETLTIDKIMGGTEEGGDDGVRFTPNRIFDKRTSTFFHTPLYRHNLSWKVNWEREDLMAQVQEPS